MDSPAVRLDERVAIVTGAGSGLGRAHALALAEHGAKIIVNDLGAEVDGSGADPQSAEVVAQEIRDLGGEAVSETSSVATQEGGQAIVRRALDEYGRVDILVNNAGNIQIASFAKHDVSRVNEILDVHLGGAIYVTQPAYRAMIEAGYGRIIFTVSGVALFGNMGASIYGAAKGGVIGLMNVLKLEAARHGVLVNAIAPGAQTRMAANVDLPEYLDVSETTLRPETVSPVVAYFASEECGLTGEIWSVAAGTVARVLVGRTRGFFKHPDRDGELTVDEIASNLSQIRESEFIPVDSWPAEWAAVMEHFRD